MQKKLVTVLLLTGAVAVQANAYACFTLDGKCRYAVTFEQPIAIKSLYSFDKIDIHNIAYLRLDFVSGLNFGSLGITPTKLQKEITENNKRFVASIDKHNRILLIANRRKITPSSLLKPEMRSLAIDIIESQLRAKSFMLMSESDPSIYGMIFSATIKDKKRLEHAFSSMKFIGESGPIQMPPSVMTIQERYQTTYTQTIHQIPNKPDYDLYKHLQKVASEFYSVQIGQ